MKRIQPTDQLDAIGPLQMPMLQCLGEVIESKRNTQMCLKPPGNDGRLNDIDYIGVKADCEHKAILKQQRLLQEHQRIQSIVNANKIEEMYDELTRLRKEFIKMNNYIKDCDDKKRHARAVIAGQSILHKKFRTESNELRHKIKEMTKFRHVLRALVKNFEPYEHVINDFIKEYKLANSIEDCMYRCDALMIAQDEINTLKKETLKKIEAARNRIRQKINEALISLMGLHTMMNDNEKALVEAQCQCGIWEKRLVACKNALIERDLEGARIVDGIHDTYRVLCKFNGSSPVLHDMEEQMALIYSEILVYKEIWTICEAEMSEQTSVDEKKNQQPKRK